MTSEDTQSLLELIEEQITYHAAEIDLLRQAREAEINEHAAEVTKLRKMRAIALGHDDVDGKTYTADNDLVLDTPHDKTGLGLERYPAVDGRDNNRSVNVWAFVVRYVKRHNGRPFAAREIHASMDLEQDTLAAVASALSAMRRHGILEGEARGVYVLPERFREGVSYHEARAKAHGIRAAS